VSDGQKLFVAAILIAVIVSMGYMTTNPPADDSDDRGNGDDQSDEGTGLVNLKVIAGLCFPPEHTKWHYGPGNGALPGDWERHRGSYPYTQDQFWAHAVTTPLSSPAFPKNQAKWFCDPPSEKDL
jgi:hypothetical protein